MSRSDIEKRLAGIESRLEPPPRCGGGVLIVPAAITGEDLSATLAALDAPGYGQTWLVLPETCELSDWAALVELHTRGPEGEN